MQTHAVRFGDWTPMANNDDEIAREAVRNCLARNPNFDPAEMLEQLENEGDPDDHALRACLRTMVANSHKDPEERFEALEQRTKALLETETEETIMPIRTRHEGPPLTEQEKRLAEHFGLTEEETFGLRHREHSESLAEAAAKIKGARGTTAADEDGLTSNDHKLRRTMGLSVPQMQICRRDSLLAEQARLESR